VVAHGDDDIPFLATVMSQQRWRDGQLSTGYIAEEFPEGFTAPAPAGTIARNMAAVAACVDHLMNARKRQISGQMPTRKPVTFEQERVVFLGDEAHDVTISGQSGDNLVQFAGEAKPVPVTSNWRPGDPVWTGLVGRQSIAVQVRPILNGMRLSHGGAETTARVYTRREAALAKLMPVKKAADTSMVLLCPMPGLVKSIAVTVGQEVKAGETLAVVEAMKMENVLRAEKDLTIKALKARPGDSLAVDAIIMEFA
jgi:propionyl-CoA carboxylase alpha chain